MVNQMVKIMNEKNFSFIYDRLKGRLYREKGAINDV
jgi:hypothetical protein